MKNELVSIVKKLEGKILLIGFSEDDKVTKSIDKNNKKYTLFSHLTNQTKEKKGFRKKRKFLGNKTINIKKLYKELGKERYDYVVCDFEIIKSYFNNFIKNSYKLTEKNIYFFINDDLYDFEEVIKRYSRYKAKCSSKGTNDEYIVTIDVEDMKYNIFKAFLYSFRDLGYNIAEFITSIIMS